MLNNISPLLITGLPRSGTTWVGEILSASPKVNYIFEPDNEKNCPIGWLYKSDVHRFPYLSAQDSNERYEEMWRIIFSGGGCRTLLRKLWDYYLRKKIERIELTIGSKTGFSYINKNMNGVGQSELLEPYRTEEHPFISWLLKKTYIKRYGSSGKRMIVKSVHAPLCLNWMAAHFDINVAVVLRNPYSLYASYKRMKMPDSFRNILYQQNLRNDLDKYLPGEIDNKFLNLDPVAFQLALMFKVIEARIKEHPKWLVISHDHLCTAPEKLFRALFQSLNLDWSDKVTAKLDSLNRTGEGYNPSRVSKDQPTKWRSELSKIEKESIDKYIEAFNLQGFLTEHVY